MGEKFSCGTKNPKLIITIEGIEHHQNKGKQIILSESNFETE